MVLLESNLRLTVKHLAPCGAVVPAEILVAMDHSLPIKRSESGLKTLTFWGRLTTRNGKDYYVAEGCNGATRKGQLAVPNVKYYFTQDGARWADLPAVDQEAAGWAAKLHMQLSGDPAFQYSVGTAASDTDSEAKSIAEVQRLRCIIDDVNSATAVQPKGCYIVDAHNQVVPNRLFAGLQYPDKLESYVHRPYAVDNGQNGGLEGDVRGSWSVSYNSFKGHAVLRSLLFPGYCFYYSASDLTWGSLYVGDGLRNADLVFML